MESHGLKQVMIGTGTLSDKQARYIAKSGRRCGRELVGNASREGETCSVGLRIFEPACQYHITPAEKDAYLLAGVAFKLGREGFDADNPEMRTGPEEWRTQDESRIGGVEEKRYFVLSELAEANGLSVRAVADAARAGKITTYQPHRTRLVTLEDFEAYMSRFRSGPPAVGSATRKDDAAERFLRKEALRRARGK